MTKGAKSFYSKLKEEQVMKLLRRVFSAIVMVIVLVGFAITPISSVFAAYGMDPSNDDELCTLYNVKISAS